MSVQWKCLNNEICVHEEYVDIEIKTLIIYELVLEAM